jgi:hypothetical protein
MGHFPFLAERVGCTRHILVPRPADSFTAQIGCPADLSNRVGSSTHRSPEIKNAPHGGIFYFWRRGWDVLGTSCASPCGQLRCTNRLSCRVVEPSGFVHAATPPGNKKCPTRGHFLFLAERVGFEPTLRHNRKPDFESGAFDHSATSPLFLNARAVWLPARRICSSRP